MAATATATAALLLFILATLLHLSPAFKPMTLTIVNNCPFTIWPAIQPNAGHDILRPSGFPLNTLTHHSFPAPDHHWSGRIWARTDCTHTGTHLTCATGDCGGRAECDGAGGAAPATLAQITLHHGGDRDLASYGVSVVDGFNVGMSVTPHKGSGVCPVVGCRVDLLKTCPDVLQVRAPANGGKVVGCKSGCLAFGTDELCCRNKYNSPKTCRSSTYSDFFKRACPESFTYAHDSPSLTHDCSAPDELKVIFCH